jgi:hypothetical protein
MPSWDPVARQRADMRCSEVWNINDHKSPTTVEFASLPIRVSMDGARKRKTSGTIAHACQSHIGCPRTFRTLPSNPRACGFVSRPACPVRTSRAACSGVPRTVRAGVLARLITRSVWANSDRLGERKSEEIWLKNKARMQDGRTSASSMDAPVDFGKMGTMHLS